MKHLIFTIAILSCALCNAQEKDQLSRLPSAIYYYINSDEDIFSDELVILFSDSSFYYRVSAPMMCRHTTGQYTCVGDSVYLTSYQMLDTLKILNAEEYMNPLVAYSTIVVLDEENDTVSSSFIINGTQDTLFSSPTQKEIKYYGDVNEIGISVGGKIRFSKYQVHSSSNNVFHLQINYIESDIDYYSFDLILKNRLFILHEQTLYDTSRKVELKLSREIPKSFPDLIDDMIKESSNN